MTVLACAMHWEVSAMFAGPVLLVGGWGWWSSRRIKRQGGGGAGMSGGEPGSGAGHASLDFADDFELPELELPELEDEALEDDAPVLAAR